MKTEVAAQRARKFLLAARQYLSLHEGSRTILMISNDEELDTKLRSFANRIGLLLIRAERTAGIVA
ncbi:MAG TPA: hypothetical protein VL361_26585, partial [Candidatus Limnocylindrales bacterium]|nr:hypothetical protein [Candidatus Limnocylindrales bacterium]